MNYLATRKREHSRKPDEQYGVIEACSPGPFVELFARGTRRRLGMLGRGGQRRLRADLGDLQVGSPKGSRPVLRMSLNSFL